MGPRRFSSALWATPLAWAAFAAVMLRLGRTSAVHAATAGLVVLLGVAVARCLAGRRGGVAGRVAELILVCGAVGWMLAEPAGHRAVISLAVALAAAAVNATGLWPNATLELRRRLAALAGGVIGLVVVEGLAGAPAWGWKAALLLAASSLTAALLARTAGPLLAIAATAALAVSIGPAHVAAWLLPPLVAAALIALEADRGWLAAGAGVMAALLPPAGLALSAGLIVAGSRRARSFAPLMLVPVALLVGLWRLPPGAVLFQAWSLDGMRLALPFAPTAFLFLLPAALIGLLGRRPVPAEARDGLAVALLALPFLGPGPWSSAAAAALWLAALPTTRGRERAVAATLSWSLGVSGALLLAAPWGGAAVFARSALVLVAGWSLAALLSLLPARVVRFAWILPLAGLIWSTPVEGVDRHLDAGQELRLPSRGEAGWVLLVGVEGRSVRPETPLLETADHRAPPLVAGRDAPVTGGRAHHPLAMASGRGRRARIAARGLSRRAGGAPMALRAGADVVVRAEPAVRWQRRRRRLAGLLGGALLLLLLAEAAPRAAPLPIGIGLTTVIAGLFAAGSGFAPLARLGFRAAPDVAAFAWLAAAAGCWKLVGRRRLLAGFLLLLPVAAAQPLLRHAAGDEVYHLKLAQSLVTDHDLDIRNNLDAHNPTEAAYLRDPRRFIHSPALAVLILPGFIVFGPTGALVLMAFLTALAAALAARRAAEMGFGRRAVLRAWLLSLLTYPALTFASQLWPAALGMAAAAVLLWAAARPAPVVGVAAALVAILVKVRLGLIAVPVALVTALRRRRWIAVAGLGVAVIVAAAIVTLLLGGPLGVHHLRELAPASPIAPLRALWGLAWDAAGGLAFAAPLWLVALTGLVAVWRSGGPGERALLAGAALTVLALLPRGEWYGGGSPPARYLAPLLPLVLLALAAVADTVRGRRLLRMALPLAVLAAWVAVTRPLWWFNPTDGGFWLSDGVARSLHVAARRTFPSLIRPDAAALTVPLIVLGFALWWRRRPHAGAAAATLVAFTATVAWAAAVPAPRVEVEDPQVLHLGGRAAPPPGSFFRSAHAISWRLAPGEAVEVPWRAPLGRTLTLRARRTGCAGHAALTAAWRGGPTVKIAVRGGDWRDYRLPRPPGLGRGRLRLEWKGGAQSAVLLDRVEAAP